MTSATHGGDIYSYYEKTGREPLDYSANINPYGLPEGIIQAVADSIADCCNYPDVHCRTLCRAVAAWEQVPEETLFFGNGAADIIFRLVHSLRPKAALVLAPTFHEYEAALQSVCCPVNYYALDPRQAFAIQPDILHHIPKNGIVFLCNPNNPTGALTGCGFMQEIADACREMEATLVVDECFLDFVETPEAYSAKSFFAEYSNLVILKAFTKLFAIPGLRLGYCLCTNKALLLCLAAAGQPWAVSVPAQAAGIAACKEQAYVEQSVSHIQSERRFLVYRLKELGFEVFPGGANFILFRIQAGYHGLREFMEGQGILLRSCANYRGLGERYFRIAVKLHRDNLTLLEGIKLWLAQL